MKNAILLIAASHAHILFVSALTGVSLVPLCGFKALYSPPSRGGVDHSTIPWRFGGLAKSDCSSECLASLQIHSYGGGTFDGPFAPWSTTWPARLLLDMAEGMQSGSHTTSHNRLAVFFEGLDEHTLSWSFRSSSFLNNLPVRF